MKFSFLKKVNLGSKNVVVTMKVSKKECHATKDSNSQNSTMTMFFSL
jgi:hypothetical protein